MTNREAIRRLAGHIDFLLHSVPNDTDAYDQRLALKGFYKELDLDDETAAPTMDAEFVLMDKAIAQGIQKFLERAGISVGTSEWGKACQDFGPRLAGILDAYLTGRMEGEKASEPAAPAVTREQADRVMEILFLAFSETVDRAKGYADKGAFAYWSPLYDLFIKDRKAFARSVADALEGK